MWAQLSIVFSVGCSSSQYREWVVGTVCLHTYSFLLYNYFREILWIGYLFTHAFRWIIYTYVHTELYSLHYFFHIELLVERENLQGGVGTFFAVFIFFEFTKSFFVFFAHKITLVKRNQKFSLGLLVCAWFDYFLKLN